MCPRTGLRLCLAQTRCECQLLQSVVKVSFWNSTRTFSQDGCTGLPQNAVVSDSWPRMEPGVRHGG
jgi:hypothetical protein